MLWLALMVGLGGCGGDGDPPADAAAVDGQACEECHAGIETHGGPHDVGCAACHQTPSAATTPWDRRPAGHALVAANPSAPGVWQEACGGCHAEALERMRRSLHLNQSGVIQHTRVLWGAQEAMGADGPSLPGWVAASAAYPPPAPPAAPTDPAQLVDDLLRRRCLRCHLYAPAGGAEGLYRGSGCAACHVPYADDGLYQGGDAAMQCAEPGRPSFHRIERPMSNTPCLRCHHGDATGGDYVGLFPTDDHDEYRVPRADGSDPPMKYGQDHHALTADLHADAGLVCVDCHGIDEVMGAPSGEAPVMAFQAVDVRCGSCHGDLDGQRGAATPGGLVCRGDACALALRSDGRSLPVPATTATAGAAHAPTTHARLACAACHAAWAGQSFGLHAHLSYTPTWNLWLPRSSQGDVEFGRRVDAVRDLDEEQRLEHAPRMTDRLDGDERDGIWGVGRTLRRWEEPALGVTPDGRIAPLRPRNDYRVTYVGGDGLVYLDSVPAGSASEPFTPHTTSAQGAACTRCHGNPRAAGLGIGGSAVVEALHEGTRPAAPATPGARLLGYTERDALLTPSTAQRRAHAIELGELGLERWLPEGESKQDAH